MSPRRLLERLDDRFRLLDGGPRDGLPRHRTLRTAIGWSHELCTPPQRLLWARLSVFAGTFDLEAVEYVCGGEDLPAHDVLDVLAQLLDQSVLGREETPAGVRYRMLDTVRAYGAEWLTATGDAGRPQRREGDLPGARGLLTDCLRDAHAFHDLLGSVLAVELLALVTVAEGDAAEAAVLQGAAAGMWPSVGLPLSGSAYYNTPHQHCEPAAPRTRKGGGTAG